ncbi:MAG: hypothetical protein AB1444_13580, partial [Spirochaetota bacterium]
MKLTFEPNLEYQQKAINSIVGLFEGQDKDNGELNFKIIEKDEDQLFTEITGIGNKLLIADEQI